MSDIQVLHDDQFINKLKILSSNAEILAKEKHEGQMYGNEPYYKEHIERVVKTSIKLWSNLESDEEYLKIVIVAYLHDIMEDTDINYSYIKEHFGPVHKAVFAITKQNNENYDQYLTRCKRDTIARKVKLADAWCNLQASVLSMDLRRIKKYIKVIDYMKY